MVQPSKDITAVLMTRLSEAWSGLPIEYALHYDLRERQNPNLYDGPNGIIPRSVVAAWIARDWVADFRDLSAEQGHLTLTGEGRLIVWAFNAL
jgi:hypothetical protein